MPEFASKVTLPPVFGLDHAAYRCRDAQETIDFYEGILKFPLEAALINEVHATTKEPLDYLHLFFDIGSSAPGVPSYIAFFDVPGHEFDYKKQWGMDLHFAMKVKDRAAIDAWREHLLSNGVACDGPVDHGVCTSLYFHDPNGYRLEFIFFSKENADAWSNEKSHARQQVQSWYARKAQIAAAASA